MKITYIPEEKDGNQVQGDTIEKYEQVFHKGQTKTIENLELAMKLIKCPFFVEAVKEGEVEVIKAPKKKTAKKNK